MSKESRSSSVKETTRREFIKDSSLFAAGSGLLGSLDIARAAHPFGNDTIRIGLVGCGGRGTGAAVHALNTTGGRVKLVAVSDVFADQVQKTVEQVQKHHPDKFHVPRERQFVGFDGYKRVLESDIDLVIFATPPGFRPLHFEAAVAAGKDIFMEKPLAVDAPGVRRILAANEEAKKKGLAVAVGLQRHHEDRYKQIIQRLQDGAIGPIIATRAYWNGAGVWVRARTPKQTELEYQMRNWYYFNWLSGDHIVEQHIHNLDVINWLKRGYPTAANGQGGRQVRNGKDHGQIFDHHFVEYEYADGSRMHSQCRHIKSCWGNVSEHAHGSRGSAHIAGGKIYKPNGDVAWSYGRGGEGGHQQEHHDLFASLRRGERPNEGEYGALSSMTAILGRMATYSGQMVTWEEAISSEITLADVDGLRSFEDTAPVIPDPDGNYPVPVPGVTQTV